MKKKLKNEGLGEYKTCYYKTCYPRLCFPHLFKCQNCKVQTPLLYFYRSDPVDISCMFDFAFQLNSFNCHLRISIFFIQQMNRSPTSFQAQFGRWGERRALWTAAPSLRASTAAASAWDTAEAMRIGFCQPPTMKTDSWKIPATNGWRSPVTERMQRELS